MRSIQRATVVALVSVGVLVAPANTVASAARDTTTCVKTYTAIPMFRNAAITAYRGTHTPTFRDLAHLRHFIRCARHPWRRATMWRIWRRSKRMNAGRKLAASITPYNGWAIPAAIVYCESRYLNVPPNSASASGYYQIIHSTWAGFGGYDAAYLAPKFLQDEKASALWNHGKGASQWTCSRLVAWSG